MHLYMLVLLRVRRVDAYDVGPNNLPAVSYDLAYGNGNMNSNRPYGRDVGALEIGYGWMVHRPPLPLQWDAMYCTCG